MTDIMGKEFDQPMYASCAHERWYTAGVGGGDDEDAGKGAGCRPGRTAPHLPRLIHRLPHALDAVLNALVPPNDHRDGRRHRGDARGSQAGRGERVTGNNRGAVVHG
jgi:hypothetical protein